MSVSRRDVLRIFGAGSTIVPFVGGSQVAVARLVEIPNVEIIEPTVEIIKPFSRRDVVGAEVILKMRDGTTRRQEHFDFSFYPIDFKKATIRCLTEQSISCPTCGRRCSGCEYKLSQEARP